VAGDNTIHRGIITVRLRALASDTPLELLIVDDDELARALLADQLQNRGFRVQQAADGVEALRLMEQQLFPLALVDWRMPAMDGIELTRRLRERGLQDTYVIMLTSKDEAVDYEQGYLAGADDYLSKKVRDVELMARIHSGLTTFSLRRELRQTRAELAAARDAR
jgi:DNA-binding response OmpR family regulator